MSTDEPIAEIDKTETDDDPNANKEDFVSKPHRDHALLHAVLRQDFSSFLRKTFQTLSPGQIFVPGWHIGALAYQLERVRRGEITRLIINMPPRSLKSLTTSVAFPAFVLGHNPTRRIICASYSGELAHKLSNDFRASSQAPGTRQSFQRPGYYQHAEHFFRSMSSDRGTT